MKTSAILATLFGAYGKADQTDQILIYTKMLEGKLPPALIEKAVQRAIYECRFLPSIAELITLAESLNAEVNPAVRVKTWDEAWGEIERKMYSTGWGKDPEWSTPEIAATMAAFGGVQVLQLSPEGVLPTNRAQVKKIYESVCARSKEKARNEFILGKNPVGLLGIQAAVIKEMPGALPGRR